MFLTEVFYFWYVSDDMFRCCQHWQKEKWPGNSKLTQGTVQPGITSWISKGENLSKAISPADTTLPAPSLLRYCRPSTVISSLCVETYFTEHYWNSSQITVLLLFSHWPYTVIVLRNSSYPETRWYLSCLHIGDPVVTQVRAKMQMHTYTLY